LNTVVLEQTEMGDMPLDVYQKLSNDRILFITGDITEKTATDICATLLLKSHENEEKKITIFINADGGDIRDVFMIYDMMQMINAPIETICVGAAAHEATMILSAGQPGMRLATENAIICIAQLEHKHLDRNNLVDVNKYMSMTEEDNKRYLSIIAKTTGKPIKQVVKDFDRRVFMNASKALKYGLIDKVIRLNK
jgi:ATP-dependent Clp protease protease subunit